MSTPVKRKAGSPLSDVEPEAKPKAPGPSSPSPKEKSPTPAPSSPGTKEKSLPSSPEATAADQTAPGMLSGAHWLQQHQQAETDDELDSSLGSDAESSTASIASTIYNYRVLHGRTYHSEAVTDNEYWGPNDQKQIEALDIYYHGIWLMLGEKLHQAPIKDDIKHAIDIGTGSGLWAVDFADKYPNCEVIGTDISPIQPSWCPPNLNFQIDDATKPWTFKKNHFDYVHIMFMNGSIADWDAIYQEAYRCCKPGGWIEHVDVSSIMRSDDDSIIPGSAIDQYGKILVEAGKRFGRSASVSEDGKQEEGIKAAGFVNMEVKEFKVGCVTNHLSSSTT